MDISVSKEKILEYAAKKYGTKPEYLWAKYPQYAVLRRKDNNKWYGAIMSIPAEKLGIASKECIDILDVKCEPLLIGSLIENNGFFPAYHMNKSNWITIILDGTVPLEEITSLIDMSYNLIKK